MLHSRAMIAPEPLPEVFRERFAEHPWVEEAVALRPLLRRYFDR